MSEMGDYIVYRFRMLCTCSVPILVIKVLACSIYFRQFNLFSVHTLLVEVFADEIFMLSLTDLVGIIIIQAFIN